MKSPIRQTVSFTRTQHADLLAEAERLEISFADLIRRVVDNWRERMAAARRAAPALKLKDQAAHGAGPKPGRTPGDGGIDGAIPFAPAWE
jgi:hypothetical protein